jgi:hypothetical protein
MPVDDTFTIAPPPRRLHRADRVLRAVQHALQIEVDARVDGVVVELLDETGEHRPGDVAHPVDAAELFDGRPHELFHIGAPRDVGGDGDATRAGGLDRLQRRLHAVGIHVGAHHRRAGGGEDLGRRGADATCGAGDHDDSIIHAIGVEGTRHAVASSLGLAGAYVHSDVIDRIVPNEHPQALGRRTEREGVTMTSTATPRNRRPPRVRRPGGAATVTSCSTRRCSWSSRRSGSCGTAR